MFALLSALLLLVHAQSLFDPFTTSISDYHKMLADKKITIESTTKLYLDRILKHDGKLHSVLEVNPEALQIAKYLDIKLKSCDDLQKCIQNMPLLGVTVLLKDNIATTDKLNTTAGSLSLLGSKPKKEASLVTKLRAAGAVIIGKAAMTEWAAYRSMTLPSGVSARATVINPYDPKQTPGGSSSGCGVAVAAGLSQVCIGTETFGSILNPTMNNNIYGIKPAPGQTLRDMVIPITQNEDTTGPLCRTIEDCRKVLDVIRVNAAKSDNCFSRPNKNCTVGFIGEDLDGIKGEIQAKGGVLVPISPSSVGTIFRTVQASTAIQLDHFNCNFKTDLAAYLQNVGNTTVKSLLDVFDFNSNHSVEEMIVQYPQDFFLKALQTKDDVVSNRARCADLLNTYRQPATIINGLIDNLGLDAILTDDINFAVAMAGTAGFPGIAMPRKDRNFNGYGMIGQPTQLDYLIDLASAVGDVYNPPAGFQ